MHKDDRHSFHNKLLITSKNMIKLINSVFEPNKKLKINDDLTEHGKEQQSMISVVSKKLLQRKIKRLNRLINKTSKLAKRMGLDVEVNYHSSSSLSLLAFDPALNKLVSRAKKERKKRELENGE